MPEDKKVDFSVVMKHSMAIAKLLGPDKITAAAIFEDCQYYPKENIAAMLKLQEEIFFGTDSSARAEKLEAYHNLCLQTLSLADPKSFDRIYLWNGPAPATTVYTDNSSYLYNHNPDFQPYLYELLLPEDVTPKGAVILCAGGDHGNAVPREAYQSALDFQAMGYQTFNLLNRTNHNPWAPWEAGADMARAIRYVRANAAKYRIDENRIAIAGFSNGGITCEGAIEYFSGDKKMTDVFPDYREDELDKVSADANAFLCVYGPRFKGSAFDWEGVVYPPAFFAVGRQDSAMDNLHYVYPDLIAHGVSVEIHTFAGTPHGQAGITFADGTSPFPNFELWKPLADAFLMDVFSK